jgi:HEAT repeat protein
MGRQAPQPVPDSAPAPSTPEEALLRAASAWTGRLARTLKTCRLYDRGNPTAVHFREELAATLVPLLKEHGPLTLTFTSNDVLCGAASLYPARSRDDNLGAHFYRDGIRALTFLPGIEPRELDVLVDAVLRVTGRAGDDVDLVTLLWDAELTHVNVDNVSTVASVDVDGGEAGECAGGARLMPWPGGGAGSGAPGAMTAAGAAGPGAPGTEAPAGDADPGDAGPEPRSDDWIATDGVEQAEAALVELEALALLEIDRFRSEYDVESQGSAIEGALTLIRECQASGASQADHEELDRFVLRLLPEAIATGAWAEARQAVELLANWPSGAAALEGVLGELGQPGSPVTTSAIREVDRQGAQGVQAFLDLARDLGPPAIEWLMRILADSGQKRTRRPLARLLADLVRDNPERLAPWLTDSRWYVVRNVVHTLGFVGGPAVVGLLKAASAHPERRVRQEVIAALAQVEPRVARDVLLGMLEEAEPAVFCAALHRLSSARDPEVAGTLLRLVLAPEFHQRPAEEQRALYSCLARAAGDEVLPQLEAQMHEGRWFSSGHEARRRSLARCIARIGTPAAHETLQRGARSRNGGVRAACSEALGGSPSHE